MTHTHRCIDKLHSENYAIEVDLEGHRVYIFPKVETKETRRDYCAHHRDFSIQAMCSGNNSVVQSTLQKFGFTTD